MRGLASMVALALLALPAQAAPATQQGQQLMRLAWQNLTLKFDYPQNNTEVTVHLQRKVDPLSGPHLESIVVVAGTDSYVVRGPSLQLIKTDIVGDSWATLYVDAKGAKYVSFYIPELGGTLAEIDILAMKSYRVNFHSY